MSKVVLICGADGFVGRHLVARVLQLGWEARRGVRRAAPGGDEVPVDFALDTAAARWLARLQGVDAVVNAVGTMRGDQYDAVHLEAPRALFDACVKAGVRQVVQISALGAPESARFLASKHAADAHLMQLPLDWTVLRPSLVVGRDGASSAWFRALASLPLIPLPGAGRQPLQPVTIDDLTEAVVRALEGRAPRRVIAVVGPRVMTYRQMLQGYREALGLGRAVWLPVPLALVRAGSAVARAAGSRLTSPESVRMLQAGNQAAPEALIELIGRAPRPFTDALRGAAPRSLRAEALWTWGEPLLRAALAAVWLATAWVSLFAYPILESLRMLWRVGVPVWSAPLLLVGAAALDAVFGVLTLWRPSRALWLAQLALIAGYSLIIALRLPEMLVHPFGPLLKNLPIVAILLLLLASTPARGAR